MPKPNKFMYYTISCNVPVGNNVGSISEKVSGEHHWI